MAKDNMGTIALIAALGIGGYLLYKMFQNGSFPSFGGGGGGTGQGGTTTTTTATTEETLIPFPEMLPPVDAPIVNYQDIHNAAGTKQMWTGVTYGSPGQPSVAFKENVLKATPRVQGVGTVSPKVIVTTPSKTITIAKPLAVSKGAKVVTIKNTSPAVTNKQMAKAAVQAGAPPRVVAKINAGKWY